jgi:hypothetical protein
MWCAVLLSESNRYGAHSRIVQTKSQHQPETGAQKEYCISALKWLWKVGKHISGFVSKTEKMQ